MMHDEWRPIATAPREEPILVITGERRSMAICTADVARARFLRRFAELDETRRAGRLL